jgi:hypothetical protein
MSSINAQAAGEHILDGFFSELEKSAFSLPSVKLVQKGSSAEKALAIGKSIDEHQGVVKQVNELSKKETVLRETSKKGIDELGQIHSGMPVSDKTVAEMDKAKKKNHSVAATMGALGLGGLGFGYYQYKKQNDDQLGRAYPQVG